MKIVEFRSLQYELILAIENQEALDTYFMG